ncbi:MAG: hypothetical protein H6R01_826 [Burkholderiaceae bacterium]|nr:hypothetical protein [Burkholderiaceae bacterium]
MKLKRLLPALLSALFSVVSVSAAAQSAPPGLTVEKNGNVTNYRANGNLSEVQNVSCIPLTQAKNTFTPPDLYKGAVDCLARDNFDASAKLFALAGIYARFDAKRVSDVTARQAGPVLIMNTFSAVPTDKKAKLGEALNLMQKNHERLRQLCTEVNAIGMPNYYPSYMIHHGMRAFKGNPHEGALVNNFDAVGVWKNLQSTYLHCPS